MIAQLCVSVAERLGTICVAQFNRDTTKSQKLFEMKDKNTWGKGRYIGALSLGSWPGVGWIEASHEPRYA